jgi:glycosyltransferase involved in cell wall biosynthesis
MLWGVSPEPTAVRGGVSVVVPVYNERETLPSLYGRLAGVLAGLAREHEVIFVDDGSLDGSDRVLEDIAAADPNVVVVQLARNYGQTAALAAGIDRARHEIVVTLDADLQNEPGDIPLLVQRIDEGADVVSGWRKDRQDPFLSRILPSLLANALISRATGVVLHDFGCTLKAYRRRLFESFRLYGEMHRFVPVYCAFAGGRVVEVPVHHAPRTAGRSKYGLGRTWKVVLDLITVKFLMDYGTKPIYVFGSVGAVSCVLGVLAGVTTLVQRGLDPEAYVHRNPLILLAVFLFLLGMNAIMLGLLAEIGVRTYHEARGGRAYVVRRVVGSAEPAGGAR